MPAADTMAVGARPLAGGPAAPASVCRSGGITQLHAGVGWLVQR